MQTTSFRDNKIDDLIKLSNEGYSISEIARALEVSIPSVTRWRKEMRDMGYIKLGKSGRKKENLEPKLYVLGKILKDHPELTNKEIAEILEIKVPKLLRLKKLGRVS